MERIVREAFSNVIIASLHPRTSISITVQITQDDGSVYIIIFILIINIIFCYVIYSKIYVKF